MNLETIKHAAVEILAVLAFLIAVLAHKIDADHFQEVYYRLRIKFEEK